MGCVNEYYWDGCGLEHCVEPGNAATTFYPSNYAQAMNSGAPEQPLARYEQPVGENNVVAADILASISGGQIEYVPAYTREAPIGVYEIGFDHLGYKKPYHGMLVIVNGVEVDTGG